MPNEKNRVNSILPITKLVLADIILLIPSKHTIAFLKRDQKDFYKARMG